MFFAGMTEHYSNIVTPQNEGNSIRARLFRELDKDPLLTAKNLASILGLSYKDYRNYLTKERSEWKHYHQIERGSKGSFSHCVRYVGVVQRGEADRNVATNKGWELSRARNRFLIYRDQARLGRITWFETGKIVLHVRNPANEGKAKQLFCNGFFKSGLITDVNVLDVCVSRVHVHSGHTPFRLGQRLPRATITAFADTHGITIKIGDRTHPDSVEVLWEVQEQVEKVGALAEGLAKFMDSFNKLASSGQNGNGVSKPIVEDYSE